MSDLKPCPFCGGEAETHGVQENVDTTFILCTGCEAEMGEHPTEAEAIAAWNTRADMADAARAEGWNAAMEADDFADLVRDARAEAEKAMRKFPQPNYVISKVAEEAGEVVKAAIHMAEGRETPENLRGEMKQLIAMLYRMWTEGDGVHGLPSVAAALRGMKEG